MSVTFEQIRQNLCSRFPEREDVILGALAAVLAGEHVLLVGPPGTAKSALARAIAQSFSGRYFERLLTKFSTVDELFGPVSLKALEQDKFQRAVRGKLPTVEFGFVDEVFKSSSAILNSLLAIMNERLFHNDDERPIKCPLITLFGASNELPEDKNLDALFDRFLVKYRVEYVAKVDSFRSILRDDVSGSYAMPLEDLRRAQERARALPVHDDTVDGLIAIRDACGDAGIIASDRRWKQCLKLAQAAACLDGAKEVAPQHLWILRDALWRDPKERAKIGQITTKYADPIATRIDEVLRSARESLGRRSVAELEMQLAYLQSLDVDRARLAMGQITNMIQEAKRPAPAQANASLGIGVVGVQRNNH